MGKFPISMLKAVTHFQFPIKFKIRKFLNSKFITHWKLETVNWRLGYTLIELLIALTILGIIFGFGYISFRDFSRRQALNSAVRNVSGDLRLTQELALSGKKPVGCTTLSGFRFKISPSSYDIVAVCGSLGTEYGVKTGVSIAPGITMSASPSAVIFFKILGQGNNLTSGTDEVITLTQTATGKTQTVTVTSGGEIK